MSTGVSLVLREAHRLRKHLAELRIEIERGPRVLKAQQTKLAKIEQEQRDAQDHLKKLQLQIREQEVSFKTANQQIAKYSSQVERANNAKELEAAKHQLEHVQTQAAQLEESILNALTEVDTKTAELPSLDEKVKAARLEFATFEKDAQARHARLIAEVQFAEAELKKVEAEIGPKERPLYDRLVQAYKESAFAAAKGMVCEHCHTAITETQKRQLANGEFSCCPSCGRGLYLVD